MRPRGPIARSVQRQGQEKVSGGRSRGVTECSRGRGLVPTHTRAKRVPCEGGCKKGQQRRIWPASAPEVRTLYGAGAEGGSAGESGVKGGEDGRQHPRTLAFFTAACRRRVAWERLSGGTTAAAAAARAAAVVVADAAATVAAVAATGVSSAGAPAMTTPCGTAGTKDDDSQQRAPHPTRPVADKTDVITR